MGVGEGKVRRKSARSECDHGDRRGCDSAGASCVRQWEPERHPELRGRRAVIGANATIPTQDGSEVLVIGEALVDIIRSAAGALSEHVGGSPANVAVGLSRLDHSVELATWIAPDPRGERIAAHLAAEAVALTPKSLRAPRTSTATAQLDPTGSARYEFDLSWEFSAANACAAGRHIHTGSIAAVMSPGGEAVASTIRSARESSTVSYDPNVRPQLMGTPTSARDRVEAMVSLADVVKASDEDLAWLYPNATPVEVLAAWASMGPALCVATRGSGTVLVVARQEQAQFPTRRATVIDTVGAGDSFMAGLISGLLDSGLLGGVDARQRLRACSVGDLAPVIERAITCAAITVSRAGADSPRRRDL